MLRLCFVLLLWATAGILMAQDTLRGVVLNQQREPLMAAHIYWQDQPTLGTFTDIQGRFTLPFSTPGDSLRISLLGYQEAGLRPQPGAQPLEIILSATEYELSALLVEGKDPISDAFLLTKQEQLDIYLNPVAAADPLRALINLPASTNTSESANPELRGSSADRSRVLVNGVPVYRPVRNTQINGIGNFSLFNTELLQHQYVYPTNAPLTRGNSTAGAVAIETVKELPQNYTQLSLGLANAGVLRGQRLGERNFFQAYANRQFSGGFLTLNQSKIRELESFQSQDAGFNLHLEPLPDLQVDLLAYGIDESYGLRLNILGQTGRLASQRQRYFHTLRLRKNYRKGSLSLHHGFDGSETDFTFGNTDSRQRQGSLYTAFDWRRELSERWEMQTGIVHEQQSYVFRDSLPLVWFRNGVDDPAFAETDSLRMQRLETYRYVRYQPHDDWLLQAGLRMSLLKRDFGRYLSGQLSARYQLTQAQALLLSGGYYQSFSLPTSFDKQIRLLNSWQLAMDYDYLSTEDLHLHLAAYYKRESGQYDRLQNQLEDHRKIFGLEALIEQPLTTYWSYSLSATWLQQRVFGAAQEWSGTQDQLFLVKALLQYRHPDWFDFGLNYITHNGLWTTRLLPAAEPGLAPSFPGLPNDFRLQPYGSLNLSLSRYFPWGKRSLVLFLNVNNLLDQGNEADLRYTPDFHESGREYYQRRSIYFGLVWKL